jgi:hypothetical protein
MSQDLSPAIELFLHAFCTLTQGTKKDRTDPTQIRFYMEVVQRVRTLWDKLSKEEQSLAMHASLTAWEDSFVQKHNATLPPGEPVELLNLINSTSSRGRKAWIQEGPMWVYMCYPGVRYISATEERFNTLEIASIEVLESHRGQGIFTRFLDFCETLDEVIYIENVTELRFQAFFKARGYRPVIVAEKSQIDFLKDMRIK